MSAMTLALIGGDLGVDASSLVTGVLSQWHGDDRPVVQTLIIDQVLADKTVLENAKVAWVVLDHADDKALDLLLGILVEANLCAVITVANRVRTPGESMNLGLVAAGPDTGPLVLLSILRTVWSMADKVDDLKTEINLLNAHHGGLADQIDKIDEELRLAAQLQKEFLPTQLPEVPGFDFQVLFRPAGYVSGDIYDILMLDEDHVGLFLADAVGHGVPAALMTMYIKRSLHTKDVGKQYPNGYRLVPPGETLARLNRDMCRQTPGAVRFATACYGILDWRCRQLTIARAGHPYPVILRDNQLAQYLDPDGAMLGIFPDEQFESQVVNFDPGDRLLIYSDGFELAFPDPDDPGDQSGWMATRRYIEEFKDLANGPLDEAMGRLTEKLDRQAGSLNQRDDMTIICVDINAEASVLDDRSPTPVVRALAG